MWLARELGAASRSGAIAGIVGAVSLFWLASVLFSSLRTSLNAVLNLPAKSNAIIQKLLDFLLMIVVLVLLLASTFLSPIVTLLERLGTQYLPLWLANLLDTAIPRVVAISITVILYLVLFRMLPNERLSRPVLLVSAMTTVILTEAMRLLFVYYMTHISSIGTLYGTYAFLIGISLWIYYASLAFLIGAEVGWLYKERHEIPPQAGPVLLADVHDKIRDPGEAVLEEDVVTQYEQSKNNPARPAGGIKSTPDQTDGQ
jgi:membrane protein